MTDMPYIGDLVRARLDAMERGDTEAVERIKRETQERITSVPGAQEALDQAREHAPITGGDRG